VSPGDTEIIESIKHPAVVAARKSGGPGADNFLIDGHRLVARGLAAHAAVDALFFLDPIAGEEATLLERARRAGIAHYLVRKGVFFKILDLGYETSVRVLATVKRPPSADLAALVGPDSCVLVGESIQDPRNVGVMIRTADGWRGACALFSADSADPYSRACVRSTTGSIFNVPLALSADVPKYLEKLKSKSLRIIGASAHAKIPCWEADLAGPCAIVLGNETTGLSAQTAAVCDLMVTVPMSGGAESFNVTVAAGMLLSERARQKQEP
jgi:tRNA G18 (ribose-2'-O)-methylase SpoU